MIAFTVAAIASATLGVYLFRQESQRRVIEQFNVSAVWKNGQVDFLTFRTPKSGENIRLDDRLPSLQSLEALRVLEMRFVKVSDKGLAVLPKLKRLEELHLGHAFHFPADADLEKVFMSSNFRGSDVNTKEGRAAVQAALDSQLQIIRALEITDEGMVHVGSVSGLRKLVLKNTAISDKGLERLEGLTQLEELDIRMTYVSNEGIASLTKLPKLTDLDLRNMRYISDAAMDHCAKLTSLRRLRLPTLVTDAGIAKLANLKQLQLLDVSQCQVTDAGIEKLRENLPNCEIVQN